MKNRIDVEFEGNCMVITGTISIQYSEDDIAATEKYFDSLSQQNADLQIDLIEESTGLTGLTVRYIFLDAEGNEVFSKEYSKSEQPRIKNKLLSRLIFRPKSSIIG